jgi:hypothetical protein
MSSVIRAICTSLCIQCSILSVFYFPCFGSSVVTFKCVFVYLHLVNSLFHVALLRSLVLLLVLLLSLPSLQTSIGPSYPPCSCIFTAFPVSNWHWCWFLKRKVYFWKTNNSPSAEIPFSTCFKRAMPWRTYVVYWPLTAEARFAQESVHVGFVVGKVVLEQGFLQVLWFSLSVSFHWVFILIYHLGDEQ